MDHSFIKFSSGLDVFNSLQELVKNSNSILFLISAVGDLSRVSFKCPLNKKPIIFEKKLEIITLSGYLRSSNSHIHISVSDENCNVFGGHLLPGTIVLKSLDILLSEIPNLMQHTIVSKNQLPANVEVYVLPDCPWSRKALKLLDLFNIKYNYFLITNDEDFKSIRKRTSFTTFPQIFINNKFIGGYSELEELSNNGELIKLIN